VRRDQRATCNTRRPEDKGLLLNDFSGAIIVTAKPRPAPAQELSVAFDGETMILTWSENLEPDIVSYHVFEVGLRLVSNG